MIGHMPFTQIINHGTTSAVNPKSPEAELARREMNIIFDFSATHWSTLATMQRLVTKGLVPYLISTVDEDEIVDDPSGVYVSV